MNFLESSFFSNICGDKELNFTNKMKWILISLLNFLFSLFLPKDDRIRVLSFNNFKNFDVDDKTSSPSRIISDIFWKNLPWHLIRKSLHKNFKIVEIGCGTGKYSKLIPEITKEYFDCYLGVDINQYQQWKNLKKKEVNFITSSCYDVKNYIRDNNVIITQSAIEHFKSDLLFFHNLKNEIDSKKKIIQIHLLPSTACLFTYLNHGYRHYNINSLSKITRIYKDNCKIYLFKLGSANLNYIHFNNITLQKIINKKERRFSNNEVYYEAVRKGINKLKKVKNIQIPSFYSIIITHNIDEDLFL